MRRRFFRFRHVLALIAASILSLAAAGDGRADDGLFSLSHARGFKLERRTDGILATIWSDGERNGRPIRYLMVPNGETAAPDDPTIQLIAVPVRRLVCLSTTHLAYIDAAGCTDRLVGLADFKHVNTPSVIRRIEAGRIKAVGHFNDLRIETLLDLTPDLILTSASGTVYDSGPKLREAGLPIAAVVDHLETHPLGRLEWIKFLGLLLGTHDHAYRYFDETAALYSELVGKTSTLEARPRVLTGAPFQGQWWVVRGDSFMARYIGDAGGDYLWSSMAGTGSLPMDIEVVYERALDADVWLNTGVWRRVGDALSADPRFGILPALKIGQLYNNDNRLNQWGGNDFWESGMLHPEIVLADLIAIFHPDLLPTHELVYYRRLGGGDR